MKYVFLVLTFLPVTYLLSYARYEWSENKSAAVGAAIIAVLSVAMPAVLVFLR